jgi:hypothetical protein
MTDRGNACEAVWPPNDKDNRLRAMAARETDQAGCARSAARDSSALSHRPEVPIWTPLPRPDRGETSLAAWYRTHCTGVNGRALDGARRATGGVEEDVRRQRPSLEWNRRCGRRPRCGRALKADVSAAFRNRPVRPFNIYGRRCWHTCGGGGQLLAIVSGHACGSYQSSAGRVKIPQGALSAIDSASGGG